MLVMLRDLFSYATSVPSNTSTQTRGPQTHWTPLADLLTVTKGPAGVPQGSSQPSSHRRALRAHADAFQCREILPLKEAAGPQPCGLLFCKKICHTVQVRC